MSKRGNNEGTIYRRGDGRWAAVVSLPNGERKFMYGKTRKEVADRMADVLRKLRGGVLPPPERITVGDVLHQWLTDSARGSVRASTYRSYADIVRLHLVPALGRVRLARLQPADVERLLREKLDAGLSPRRVQYIHAVLRRALGRPVRWGWIDRNVASLADAPRVDRKEIEPLWPEEIRKFLHAIGGHRLEALYVMALTLGLRRGELLGLRWSDINFDGGSVRVARSLQRVSGRTEFVEPKSARSRREVSFPAFVADVLEIHRKRQIEERLRAGEKWVESGLVFTTIEGRPLDGMNLTHHFQRLLRDLGIRRRRFHDLRHSCATVLLAQDVPARVVMEMLGHSQISLTLDTYSHVSRAMQREAAKEMDAFMRSTMKGHDAEDDGDAGAARASSKVPPSDGPGSAGAVA